MGYKHCTESDRRDDKALAPWKNATKLPKMTVTTPIPEMNATEVGRKVGLPDERLKKSKITDSMRKKVEEHVKEFIRLQIQVPDFRGLQIDHIVLVKE